VPAKVSALPEKKNLQPLPPQHLNPPQEVKQESLPTQLLLPPQAGAGNPAAVEQQEAARLLEPRALQGHPEKQVHHQTQVANMAAKAAPIQVRTLDTVAD
jgi:hypothetical protein